MTNSSTSATAGARPASKSQIFDWSAVSAAIKKVGHTATPSELAGGPRPAAEPEAAAQPVLAARQAAAVSPLAVFAAAAQPAAAQPAAAQPAAAAGVEQPPRSAPRTSDEEAAAEIARLVRQHTRSTQRPSFFTERNPLTGRDQIRYTRVIPFVLICVFLGYGALSIYGSSNPAADPKQAAAANNKNDQGVRPGEETIPKESLFAPRSSHAVTGTGQEAQGPETQPAAAPPEPEAPAAAPPEKPKPAAPNTWQAGLYMDMPAEEVEVGDEPALEPKLGITLPEGTRIQATLVGTLASSYESPVQARLDADFTQGDVVLLPAGTILLGKTQTRAAERRIHVRFHRAILPGGASMELTGSAQNQDLSTGLVADRVEKHRRRNILAGTMASIAGGAANVITGGASGAILATQAAQQQVASEARGAVVPDRTLYVNAGRVIYVYLEADLAF